MNKNELVLAGFTLILLGLLFVLFKSVMTYIAISACLAIIGSPILKLFQKIKFKNFQLSKGIAAFLTLICFYGIIALIILSVSPFIAREIQNLSSLNPLSFIHSLEMPIQKIEEFIFEYTQQQFSVESYLKEKILILFDISTLSVILNSITNFTGNILVYFFSVSFITFFFLKDGKLFFDKAISIFPKKYQNEFPSILPQIKHKLNQYLLGILLDIFILFVVLSIGLYFVGVKNYLIIALIAAILNIIPYIGPIIGVLIGLVITLYTSCSGTLNCLEFISPLIIKVLAVFGLSQLIDNLLLQPLILSKSVNAHPLEIFFVVIIIGNFYGITGMILAIPLYSVLKIIFLELRKNSSFLNSIYETKS